MTTDSKASWKVFDEAKKAALAGGLCNSCAIAAGNLAEEEKRTGQLSMMAKRGIKCTCGKAKVQA